MFNAFTTHRDFVSKVRTPALAQALQTTMLNAR